MKRTVFYSWQSDLPNSTNRGFIEKALENAVRQLRGDESVSVEPVIERDTIGVPGAPDIASTILAKIDQSDVFVCDVSIINHGARRPAPNPNVLVELGYAMKTMGAQRIVMVMNAAFGEPELLPFDLRMRRVVVYHATSTEDRVSQRKDLESKLRQSLHTILSGIEERVVAEPNDLMLMSDRAVAAVEGLQPTQATLVRKFMSGLLADFDKAAPPFPGLQIDGEPDDLLVQAIDQTEELVHAFTRVASAIALSDNVELVYVLYRYFEKVVDKYEVPWGYSGHFRRVSLDFYKFIGHELFVSMLALLIREKKWKTIADLLDESLYVENTSRGEPRSVTFGYISDHVGGLESRNQRLKLQRACLHADIIKERHSRGGLGQLVPMVQFLEADFFLFLREGFEWKPWSVVYLGDTLTPRFLLEARRSKYAYQLLRPLLLEDMLSLRARVAERKTDLRRFFRQSVYYNPLSDFDPETIATQ